MPRPFDNFVMCTLACDNLTTEDLEVDKTNRAIKICRRIEELEYQIACKDMMRNEAEDAWLELAELEAELEDLQPAT